MNRTREIIAKMKIQINRNGRIGTLLLDVGKIEMIEDIELIPIRSQDEPFEKAASRFKVYSSSNCVLYQKPFFNSIDADLLMSQIAESKCDSISIDE